MLLTRIAITCLLFSLNANAESFIFQSAVRRTSLLELYTSEGCSSCPPAEACLSKLKDSPGLWRDFVPVAFHVDYWDYLGWQDKLAQKRFSDRQRAYAQAWNSDSIYTPGYILDGVEWRNWSASKAVPRASQHEAGQLSVTSDDAIHWHIKFIPAAKGESKYEINAALVACGLDSDVRAGENAGRHLKHDFAALDLTTRPLDSKSDTFETNLDFDTLKQSHNDNLAIAFWVTSSNGLKPVQAVGGWLAQKVKL